MTAQKRTCFQLRERKGKEEKGEKKKMRKRKRKKRINNFCKKNTYMKILKVLLK